MPTYSPALVVTDGGLAGLIACWTEGVCARGLAEADAPSPVGWFPAARGPAAAVGGVGGVGGVVETAQLPNPRRLAAAGRQLELCHLADLVVWDVPVDPNSPPGFHLTQVLLAATAEAVRRGFSRVVWPVHAGSGLADDAERGLDAVAAICDRALLVSHLAELDLPPDFGQPIRIETPYADYSDRQVAELALDLDAPLGAAWWCSADAERLCGRCKPCRRWGAAFELAHRPGLDERAPDLTVTMGPRAAEPATD